MSGNLNKQLYEFSKIIKELRLQYKYTQKYVAEKLGISYQSYQAYELGIAVPTFQNFLKIANFYDVGLDYLVGNKLY
ncbi:MAG: helix-turn-helix transcriptional regulator [Clostridia bacterium]|nr:helix-turn-helix transcriptional regulator [Clostridia bacterium]